MRRRPSQNAKRVPTISLHQDFGLRRNRDFGLVFLFCREFSDAGRHQVVQSWIPNEEANKEGKMRTLFHEGGQQRRENAAKLANTCFIVLFHFTLVDMNKLCTS